MVTPTNRLGAYSERPRDNFSLKFYKTFLSVAHKKLSPPLGKIFHGKFDFNPLLFPTFISKASQKSWIVLIASLDTFVVTFRIKCKRFSEPEHYYLRRIFILMTLWILFYTKVLFANINEDRIWQSSSIVY